MSDYHSLLTPMKRIMRIEDSNETTKQKSPIPFFVCSGIEKKVLKVTLKRG